MKTLATKKLLIAACSAWIGIILSGCNGNVYEDSKSGYIQIDTIEGVSFDMPARFLSQATAISLISPDEEYIGTYVYKDGHSKYIFFNMDSIVVAAQADTDFAFSKDPTAEQVTTGNIQNIFFTTAGEKIKAKTANDKIIVDANAAVSITPTQYADFTGYLSSVYSEDTQWSIFAGICGTGDLTNEQEKTLSHIVKSFKTTGASYSVQEEKASENETVNIETETNNAQNDNETPIKNADESTEETSAVTEEPTVVEVIEDGEVKNSPTVALTEETSVEEDQSDVQSEQVLTADDPDKPKVEAPIENPQKYLQEISEKIEIADLIQSGESSSIYEPLDIGKTAWFACNSAKGEACINDITINKVYAGKEAETLLKQFNITDKPSDGTRYQVAEYALKISPEEAYANLKITGLDGERLKFRGISYTTRTHDIMDGMTVTDNGYEKLYVYYEVPNGCKEYYLTCGIDVLQTDSRAVYYVKNEDR